MHSLAADLEFDRQQIFHRGETDKTFCSRPRPQSGARCGSSTPRTERSLRVANLMVLQHNRRHSHRLFAAKCGKGASRFFNRTAAYSDGLTKPRLSKRRRTITPGSNPTSRAHTHKSRLARIGWQCVRFAPKEGLKPDIAECRLRTEAEVGSEHRQFLS